jgi:serine/threonine protein kinase
MPGPSAPFLTLLEALGEGSFGKVFKALHHTNNQIIAVKILPLEDDTHEVRCTHPTRPHHSSSSSSTRPPRRC